MKQYSVVDFQKIPPINLVVENLTSPPSSPVEGQVYWDSAANKLYVFNGSTWDNLVPTAPTIYTGGAGLTLTGADFSVNVDASTIEINADILRVKALGITTAQLADAAVTGPKIANLAVTDAHVANANKDGISTTYSMRTIGTGAAQACSGADARLSDTRVPTDGSVTLAKMAANSVDSSKIVDGSILVGDLSGTSIRLDTIAAPTGPVGMNGQRLASVADNPTTGTDGANKNYVDSVAQGLDTKQSVRAATTGPIAGGGAAFGGVQTIDGFTTSNNERILVKDQTPQYNGIYQTNSSGSWGRVLDMDTWPEVPSAFVFVEEGTVNHDTGWVCTADQSGTLNTTAIPWTQFSGAGTIIDGAALLKTGNTLDVQVDNSTIEVNADALRVKDGGITSAKILDGTLTPVDVDATYKDGSAALFSMRTLGTGALQAAAGNHLHTGVYEPVITPSLPIAKGGTGATTAAAARNNLSAAGVFIALSPALTANTYSADITHSLANAVPTVGFKDAVSNEGVALDWKSTGVNTIQIRSALALSAGAIYVTVIG